MHDQAPERFVVSERQPNASDDQRHARQSQENSPQDGGATGEAMGHEAGLAVEEDEAPSADRTDPTPDHTGTDEDDAQP